MILGVIFENKKICAAKNRSPRKKKYFIDDLSMTDKIQIGTNENENEEEKSTFWLLFASIDNNRILCVVWAASGQMCKREKGMAMHTLEQCLFHILFWVCVISVWVCVVVDTINIYSSLWLCAKLRYVRQKY